MKLEQGIEAERATTERLLLGSGREENHNARGMDPGSLREPPALHPSRVVHITALPSSRSCRTGVPFPHQVVLATGNLRIAGALALLSVSMRRLAGVMLACMRLASFQQTSSTRSRASIFRPPNSWWYRGPRLALQPADLVALFRPGAID